jgi:ABC-type phosphate transport system permease subunit
VIAAGVFVHTFVAVLVGIPIGLAVKAVLVYRQQRRRG